MEAIATFLMIIGVHMLILVNIRVKILILIKFSYSSPQLC